MREWIELLGICRRDAHRSPAGVLPVCQGVQRSVVGGKAMNTTIGLVYITTVAYSANLLLKGQLSYMRERGVSRRCHISAGR